ncbi:MAG: hypothetical protein JSW41_01550 [Candidatus Aenigmatarchaeota archaeon]|nr:MAG: hypothetical protein JSW41_01550 [Candidatus Aenigmarchaeota archaeon]
MKKRKSHFVVVIILIAIVMIVLGISLTWLMNSMSQFCSDAQVLIQRAHYNNATKDLTLVLFNTGNITLNGFDIQMVYENQTTYSKEFKNMDIPTQDTETTILSTDETLLQIVVQSLECRNAQDLIGRNDILGLGF